MPHMSELRPLVAAALLALFVTGCAGTPREMPGPTNVQVRGTTDCGPIEYVEISQRAGVTQRFLVLHARQPVGSVILFTDSDGRLRLRRAGTLERGANFLVRVRKVFAAAGFNVPLVDMPSDQFSLRAFPHLGRLCA
jgi:hypothetical protein